MSSGFKVKLILIGSILILGGLISFLVFRDYLCLKCLVLGQKDLLEKVQKEPQATNPLKKEEGSFTPLVKKNLENVEEKIKEKEPTKSEISKEEKTFAPKIGFLAPDFVLKDLNGQIITLKDFKGKNVLLVFWATYCGWCAAEKNDLIRFTNEQRKKIKVIAIVDEPKEVVLEYIKREGVNFTILLDKDRKTFDKYQTLGTPAHFLIDKNGKITDWRPGYTAYDGFLSMLETLEK